MRLPLNKAENLGRLTGNADRPVNLARFIARFGDAQLMRFLAGKMELRGGSDDDRTAAREWMSMFRHEAVVRER